MDYLHGIDVNMYNGLLNWSEIKNSGIQFAMIKATQQLTIDRYFKTNLINAHSVGISCGVCHYFSAISQEETLAEANRFLTVITPYRNKISLWCAVYVEDNKKIKSINKSLLSQNINLFCQTIQSTGFNPCIFSDSNYRRYKLNDKILSSWDVWQAQWSNKKPDDINNLVIWQYGIGNIDGLSGQFNLNYGFFDLNNQGKKGI